jgi:hypothetical protein
MLQQYRQLTINRWFSLLQNFYTWRGHTADTTIIRRLSPAAELHDDGSILHHRTEKGAIISTMQLAICTTVAYMMEGGGPAIAESPFAGPTGRTTSYPYGPCPTMKTHSFAPNQPHPTWSSSGDTDLLCDLLPFKSFYGPIY